MRLAVTMTALLLQSILEQSYADIDLRLMSKLAYKRPGKHYF